jgi:DUF1365 family protein
MARSMSTAFLSQGQTGHRRQGKTANSFRYPMLVVKFRTDKEAEFQAELRRKFRGLLSFRTADYLAKNSGGLNELARAFLLDRCGFSAEEIWLITMPRIFGYAFNPVSFWLCRRQGKLEAVLCEVNNTFSERHFYWVQVGSKSNEWISAEKKFHVSPFLPVEGSYRFRFHDDLGQSRIDVNYHGADGQLQLATWLEFNSTPLAEVSAPRIFLRYCGHTFLVVARIHYQALRLWLKGLKFFRKPALPQEGVTS